MKSFQDAKKNPNICNFSRKVYFLYLSFAADGKNLLLWHETSLYVLRLEGFSFFLINERDYWEIISEMVGMNIDGVN